MLYSPKTLMRGQTVASLRKALATILGFSTPNQVSNLFPIIISNYEFYALDRQVINQVYDAIQKRLIREGIVTKTSNLLHLGQV
jgi:hypothetical protein